MWFPIFLQRIRTLRNNFDEMIYPPLERVPPKYAILRRNEWMIDKATVLFACVRHAWGGAAKTLAYAKRKNIIIEYLP